MNIRHNVVKYKYRIILILIISLIIIPITTISPLLLSALIDNIIEGNAFNSPTMIRYFIIIIISRFSIIILTFIGNYMANFTKISLIKDLKIQLVKKYLKAYPEDTKNVKDMITIIQNDVQKMVNFLLSGVNKIIINTAKFIGLSIILIKMNTVIYFTIICSLPIYVILILLTAKKRYNYSRILRNNYSKITNILSNVMHGKKGIFLSNSTNLVSSNCEKQIDLLSIETLKSRNFNNTSNSVLAIFSLFLDFIILVLSSFLVYRNIISVGEMTVFLSYSKSLISPIKAFINFGLDYHNVKPSFERVISLNGIKTDDCLKRRNSAIIKRISLIDVKPYQKNKNITLEFEIKGILSIYGNTGSGKSTIANLIAGYLLPYSGDIFFYDEADNQYSPREVGHLIRLIDCDMFLIPSISLRYNITLGKNITDDQLVELFKVVKLYDLFFHKMDKLVENIPFSHGELQRILIIRSILDNPQVLILDEALNGVEPILASSILCYLKNKINMIIVISHREMDHSFSDRKVEII